MENNYSKTIPLCNKIHEQICFYLRDFHLINSGEKVSLLEKKNHILKYLIDQIYPVSIIRSEYYVAYLLVNYRRKFHGIMSQKYTCMILLNLSTNSFQFLRVPYEC